MKALCLFCLLVLVVLAQPRGIPNNIGFDHVGVTVPNVTEASLFLQSVFGCRFDWEVRREPTPTAGERGWSELFNVHQDSYLPHVMMLKCGDNFLTQYVELFEWASPDQSTKKELHEDSEDTPEFGWDKFTDIGHSYIAFTVKNITEVVEYIKSNIISYSPEDEEVRAPSEGECLKSMTLGCVGEELREKWSKRVRFVQDPPMEFPLRGEICTSTFIVSPWYMWIELSEWSDSGPEATVMEASLEPESNEEDESISILVGDGLEPIDQYGEAQPGSHDEEEDTEQAEESIDDGKEDADEHEKKSEKEKEKEKKDKKEKEKEKEKKDKDGKKEKEEKKKKEKEEKKKEKEAKKEKKDKEKKDKEDKEDKEDKKKDKDEKKEKKDKKDKKDEKKEKDEKKDKDKKKKKKSKYQLPEFDLMKTLDKYIGMDVEELDTPAFLIDLDAFEHNTELIVNRTKEAGMQWRPPCKAHKSPVLAKKLIEAGAEGIVVLTLEEAEIFAHFGIDDIYLANQVVSEKKLARAAKLAQKLKRFRMVVDNELNIRQIALAAMKQRKEGRKHDLPDFVIELLIEINVNHNRTGVTPQEAVSLASVVHSLQLDNAAVALAGITGYEGHTPVLDPENKTIETQKSHALLAEAKTLIEQQAKSRLGVKIAVDVVSGGGSCNYMDCIAQGVLTELQAGGGTLVDLLYRDYAHLGDAGHIAGARVLTEITSVQGTPLRAMGDAGFKSVGWHPFAGLPKFADREDLEIYGLSAEHLKIRSSFDNATSLDVKAGDKLMLIPGYIDTMILFHDNIFAYRNNKVEEVWPVITSKRLLYVFPQDV